MRSSSHMLSRSRFAYRPVESALRAKKDPALPTGCGDRTDAIERARNLPPLNGFPILEPARRPRDAT